MTQKQMREQEGLAYRCALLLVISIFGNKVQFQESFQQKNQGNLLHYSATLDCIMNYWKPERRNHSRGEKTES